MTSEADAAPATALDRETFVALVDHTLLKPEATQDQIEAVCAEALELSTAAVCVNSYWTATVARALDQSFVAVCSVVGFPLGAMSRPALAAETAQAIDDGAAEIDVVLPVGLFRSDRAEAGRYLATAREAGIDAVLKVILETALLSDVEIAQACRLAVDAGAEYVKTSTGFNPAGGATVEAVGIMSRTVGPEIGVKASGGIRTLADVQAMVGAGATRLGMSATTAVLAELPD